MHSLLHKGTGLILVMFLSLATAAMGWADAPPRENADPAGTALSAPDGKGFAPVAAMRTARRQGQMPAILASTGNGSCCACDSAVAGIAPVPVGEGFRPVRPAGPAPAWPALADSRFQPPRS